MKISTSRSYWVKEITKYIDRLGNSCTVAISRKYISVIQLTNKAKITQKVSPHCFIPPWDQVWSFCFIISPFRNIMCLKYQIYKIVLSLPYLFWCLLLTSIFLISVQLFWISCASTYFGIYITNQFFRLWQHIFKCIGIILLLIIQKYHVPKLVGCSAWFPINVLYVLVGFVQWFFQYIDYIVCYN